MPNRVEAARRSLWLDQLLVNLGQSGPVGGEAARFLIDRGARLGIRDQSAGARWTLGGNVEMHPRYVESPPTDPYALSLLVHEAQHLRQGMLIALSVYGELEAWQAQFAFLQGLGFPPPGSAEQARVIANIMKLPFGWNREVLREARRLMKAYAGRAYRVEWLPLYPVHKELMHLALPDS